MIKEKEIKKVGQIDTKTAEYIAYAVIVLAIGKIIIDLFEIKKTR